MGLDFPLKDMLLWQVSGKTDFFANEMKYKKKLYCLYCYWKHCIIMIMVKLYFIVQGK